MRYRELEQYEDAYVRLLRPKGLKAHRHEWSLTFDAPKRDQKQGIMQSVRIDYPIPEVMIDSLKGKVSIAADSDDGVLAIKTICEPESGSCREYQERVAVVTNRRLGETRYLWDWIRGQGSELVYAQIQASGFLEEDEEVWRKVLDSIVVMK